MLMKEVIALPSSLGFTFTVIEWRVGLNMVEYG